MSKAGNLFSASGPISMPAAPTPQRPVIHHLTDDQGAPSGWGFTAGGICLVVTDADIREIFSSYYAPPSGAGPLTGEQQGTDDVVG